MEIDDKTLEKILKIIKRRRMSREEIARHKAIKVDAQYIEKHDMMADQIAEQKRENRLNETVYAYYNENTGCFEEVSKDKFEGAKFFFDLVFKGPRKAYNTWKEFVKSNK